MSSRHSATSATFSPESPPPAPVVRYGTHADQVANLHLPAGDDGPWPCVILLHGGFWRERWDRTLMTPLAIGLARAGFAAWNLEYRRVGQDGGGWPGTLDDAVAGLDAIADRPELDSDRVVAVGHSAGGHLALYLAGRADCRVRLSAVVALGGVVDLGSANTLDLGGGAVAALLGGGPSDVPDRYRAADPAARLPLGVRQLLVHGSEDDVVPASLAREYAARARAAGDEVELVDIPGADHFDVVDGTHPAWLTVVDRLPSLFETA
jgi:acetyl esterase/lipase